MALRQWHYGKLIMLWAWGGFFMWFAWYVLDPLEANNTGKLIFGYSVLAVLLAIPAALSVMTWKWLGGKERD